MRFLNDVQYFLGALKMISPLGLILNQVVVFFGAAINAGTTYALSGLKGN